MLWHVSILGETYPATEIVLQQRKKRTRYWETIHWSPSHAENSNAAVCKWKLSSSLQKLSVPLFVILVQSISAHAPSWPCRNLLSYLTVLSFLPVHIQRGRLLSLTLQNLPLPQPTALPSSQQLLSPRESPPNWLPSSSPPFPSPSLLSKMGSSQVNSSPALKASNTWDKAKALQYITRYDRPQASHPLYFLLFLSLTLQPSSSESPAASDPHWSTLPLGPGWLVPSCHFHPFLC